MILLIFAYLIKFLVCPSPNTCSYVSYLSGLLRTDRKEGQLMRKQYCVAKELRENLDHPDGVKCIILGISLNEDLFH